MSFYRIYRPQVFEELDNIRVRETLRMLLAKEKKDLPHAYLFSGPRGTGKTTAARLIAKLFQCEKPQKNGEPCGTCDQCKAIAAGRAVDVIEIDAASNTGVDNIRDLREKIILAPSVAKWKIYIIDEVHMLSTGAFNALLKTLEEPPSHAVFILATTDVQKVPITIQSRALHLAFSKPSPEEIIAALTRIVEKETIAIEKDALRLLAVASDGSFRDAVKFLEQVSFHKGNINAGVVSQLLSLSDEQVTNAFLDALAKRNAKEALDIIGKLIADGKDMKTFLVGSLSRLELLLLASVENKPIDPWNKDSLCDAIRKLSSAYAEMRSSSIVQLPLELAVVEYCNEKDLRFKNYELGIKKEELQKIEKQKSEDDPPSMGLLTLDKLTECWKDFLEALKPYNHSVVGVLRSSRPKAVSGGIVTIEAFYTFHQEKLSEPKTKEMLANAIKKLFGEKVAVEVVLGKK